jgi:hypothetical protein
MQTQYMDVCKVNRPSLPNIPIKVGPTTSRGLCCLPGNITGQSKPLMNPLVSGSSADWALQRVGLWSVRFDLLRSLVITACIISGIIFARGRRQAPPLRGSWRRFPAHMLRCQVSPRYQLSRKLELTTILLALIFRVSLTAYLQLIRPQYCSLLYSGSSVSENYPRGSALRSRMVDCRYKIEIYSYLKRTIHSYDM